MSIRSEKDLELFLDNPLFTRPELMLLAHARKLIYDPKHWSSGSLHKVVEIEGAPTDQYCIQGALEDVMQSNGFDHLTKKKAEELVRMACQHRGYQAFNDSHTHAEVIEVLTLAIALGVRENINPKVKLPKMYKA